ncbi:unnamed protein product [Spirodela intermedia]|uniref:Small ribosomal subunit protein uS15c n=1 Tax=Spirodela intermedia TaxID=51605 RepID=A0A7I8JT55_SPIIN|nr:unnamed protein product [Spirodela intermedia]CAA6673360.1 unnamed protein product [Spirodela intermedia]
MAPCLRPKLAALRSIQTLRRSSYTSSTFPPPPPAASDGDGDGGGDKEDGAPPSYSSLFSEIKARLKQPSPPRRIPLSPADPPPPLGAVAPPPAAASLEEIRKNLSDFRLEKKPPPTSSSSSPFSFQDLYRNNVLDKAENAPAGAPERPSFESIRESLRQLRASQPSSSSQVGFGGRIRGANQGGLSHPLDLKSLTDRLNLRPGEAREEGGRGPAARKTEFLKMYDFEELGEKLRRLRPEEVGSGKKKGGWFSLEELNERLAKLRELEEKETEYSIGGVSFKDLRESLVKLRDADNKKTSILHSRQLGGQVTPLYMLNPPKENLYFHPDHLSAAEKLKLELNKVRDEFKMSESDCGSTRVQVAQLTTRIRYLEPILYTKKKGPDKHSIKGLIAMVKKRNRLLKYLRRTDWESYCMVLSKLNIRDIEKKETKGGKGSEEKKRGKKGKGKHSKKANYAT